MATETRLSIVVDAQDKASATLQGIKGKVQDMQPAFKTMALAGTVAFGAISYAMKDAIDSANESAKVQAQLQAVLKSTGNAAGLFAEDINDQSAALQKLTTYNDEAIGSMQNTLLTFTNIKGAVFQETVPAILDLATAMGTDLNGAAIQVGKALNDPVQGISALTRVGVTFSDAQKAVIENLVKTGQTAKAQQVIIAELNKEFGGSAAAQAKTFAGQMQQLANRFDDIKEKVGGALIPIITNLLAKVTPIIEKIADWVDKNPELTAQIMIIAAAISGLIAILGTIGLVMPAVAAGFALVTGAAAPWLLAIAAVIALGYLLYKNWDDIKGGAEIVAESVKAAWDSMVNAVTAAGQAIINFTTGMWNGIIQLVKDAINLYIGIWVALLDFLLPSWQQNLQQIFDFAVTIWNGLVSFFTSMWTTVKGLFTSGLGAVSSAWSTAWGGLRAPFTALWEGIKGVIQAAFDWISAKMKDLLKPIQKVIDLATQALNIAKSVGGSVSKAVSSGVSSLISKGSSITGINDGIVQNGNVITTHPDDYIIATKNPSSLAGSGRDIRIYIDGAVFSQDAARTLGDIIFQQLNQQIRI